MKHVQITDSTTDLRALREVVRRRAEQCVVAMNDLPMSSAAWQRERENVRYEAYRTVLTDIDHLLKSHGK
jgi:hypothetical protein